MKTLMVMALAAMTLASPASAASLIGTTATLTPIFANGAVQPSLTAIVGTGVEFSSVPNFATTVDIGENSIFLDRNRSSTALAGQFNGYQLTFSNTLIDSATYANGLAITGITISDDRRTLALNFSGLSVTAGQTTTINLTTSAITAVPEPATWMLMMVGFGLVAGGARYQRKALKASFA